MAWAAHYTLQSDYSAKLLILILFWRPLYRKSLPICLTLKVWNHCSLTYTFEKIIRCLQIGWRPRLWRLCRPVSGPYSLRAENLGSWCPWEIGKILRCRDYAAWGARLKYRIELHDQPIFQRRNSTNWISHVHFQSTFTIKHLRRSQNRLFSVLRIFPFSKVL